jgi:2-methylcitrate dehydratase PrpD
VPKPASSNANNNPGAVHGDRRAVPLGDAADPLTRAQIEDKFRMASDGLLAPDAAERMIERLGHLEQVEHVGELIASLRVSKVVPIGR